jgi:hypothetical protein
MSKHPYLINSEYKFLFYKISNFIIIIIILYKKNDYNNIIIVFDKLARTFENNFFEIYLFKKNYLYIILNNNKNFQIIFDLKK